MIEALINPEDPPQRRTEKLMIIAEALMRRAEQGNEDSNQAYAQFQRAALLEDQVRERTIELGRALDLLNGTNARLAQAKAEADSARQNLSSAIETVEEGFALFDREDRLVMCNSRFGMHMADIRGRLQPGLLFDDYVEQVSRSADLALPQGQSPAAWAAARKARHKEPHVVFNVQMARDHWVQVSEHRTADGGTVILQTDVTEIIRAERHERGKLLDNQARMIKATLEHIDQGICIFDSGDRLVDWNNRLVGLLALPAGRLRLGSSFDSFLRRLRPDRPPGQDAGPSELLRDWVAAGRRDRPIRLELRRATGLILNVFAKSMPGGGFVMSFTDITGTQATMDALNLAKETLETRVLERTLELRDALSHAERANASRSRFVAAASHDLLQPLSAAKLFIASIQAEDLEPPARTALAKAQNALLSVETILDALLDISKLELGQAALSVAPVPLERMMRQLHEEFAPMASARGLQLTMVPCKATVISDPTYLRRVLQNLISNAIRYTQTGCILVGARRRASGLRLEVWDTGPGIPPESQSDIFREFHRLNARASASEGMGLGLAIVQRACALLGHPLSLQSVMGRGSSFRLEVPLAGPSADREAAHDPRPLIAGPQPGGFDRIAFLVENDADLRRALGLVLEKWGVTVLEAETAEDALALIEEIGILPDLFLVDQHLGAGLSGLEFLAEARRRFGPVPARLITANRDTALRAAARRSGVEILFKPIDAQALKEVFSRLGPPGAYDLRSIAGRAGPG